MYCKYNDKRLQYLSRLVGGEHRPNFTMHKKEVSNRHNPYAIAVWKDGIGIRHLPY